MENIATLMLGQDEDRSFDNAQKIAALGFPDGAVFTCGACGRSDKADIAETAKAMTGDWPRCHGARMDLEAVGPTPIERTAYAIIFETSQPTTDAEAALQQLLKSAWRRFSFKCRRVERLQAGDPR